MRRTAIVTEIMIEMTGISAYMTAHITITMLGTAMKMMLIAGGMARRTTDDSIGITAS